MIKNNKKSSNISFVKVVFRILKMSFAAGPVYIIVNNLVAIINGASQGVITYMTQLFFESVSDAVTANTGIKNVIIMACALSLTVILWEVINGVNRFMGKSYFKKVIGYLKKKINEKASRIPPIAYEDTDFLDDINKASKGAENSLGLLFTISTVFFFYTPYFLFMFFYLYNLEPFLAVSLVFVFVPVALSQVIRNIVFANLEEKVAPIRREYNYYRKCTGEKETRILGAFSYFRDLFRSSLELLNKEVWKAERKIGLIELGLKSITLMGYLAILYLFVRALLNGDISVGAFAAIFASIETMFGTMDTMICQHIANMTQNLGTIKNFLRFLDIPEREGKEQEKTRQKGVSVKNLYFSYPNSDKKVLNDISFEINSGETLAIVGKNGAGKSTLVKLLLGIYQPVKGKVEIGGLDTQEACMESITKGVSAVFQKYQRYKMNLRDNIEISNFSTDGRKGTEGYPLTVEDSFRDVGLDIKSRSFPDGYNTLLSREFDGVELSLGQWQRIAIARGLYRVHDFIILDEPTAAIDPIEEANIYRKFAEISRDKTAVIITHRLGSVKMADRIVVMDSGEFVEMGTHDELMKARKLYWEMFTSQEKWYRKE